MNLLKKTLKKYIIISIFLLAIKNLYSNCSPCQYTNTNQCVTQNCEASCLTDKEQIINYINNGDICNNNCNIRLIPECSGVHSVFIPRSQGADTARELVGWQKYIFNPQKVLNTGQLLSYMKSFKPELINLYLFNRTNKLNFVGSQVENRTNCDLIADYFGLSPEFEGSLNLSPHIENIIFDNQFFFNFSDYIYGLYLRFNFPIVNTRWKLNPKEEIKNLGSNFPRCYMANTITLAANSFQEALTNNFNFGKFYWGTKDITRLADIDIILGYNLYETLFYHLGLYIQFVAPTGNKPDPTFIFSPIAGNSKHFEFGAGVSAHRTLWDFGDSFINIYLEGNLTHLFNSRQLRSFDLLNNGPLSRYLPLREFEADGTTPTGKVIPAINLTTLPINTKFSMKGDFTLKLEYIDCCGLDIDLGYNVYGRSPESIAKDNSFDNCASKFTGKNKYGIKGTSGTCYLAYTTVGTFPNSTFGTLVATPALNSTESNSTITKAGPIDSPINPVLPVGANIGVTWDSAQTGSIESADVILAKQSAMPKTINLNSIDYNSGLSAGSLTHTLFTYIGYNYPTYYPNLDAYFGIGGKIEFNGKITSDRVVIENCATFEPRLIYKFLSSLNQWGIWLKAGISY